MENGLNEAREVRTRLFTVRRSFAGASLPNTAAAWDQDERLAPDRASARLPHRSGNMERCSERRVAGSEITLISVILPSAIVILAAKSNRPDGATTIPTVPSTSIGRAVWARPTSCLATEAAPRISC